MPYAPRALRALMSHVPRALHALVPYVLSCSSYKWYKSPGSINLTRLTSFMPLVSFYSLWKFQESWDQWHRMGWFMNSSSSGKKYDVITKCSQDSLHINDVNILYTLRVAKDNKNEFQNFQELKETGKGLVKFQFKLD